MRLILFLYLTVLLTAACNKSVQISSMDPVNWEKRSVNPSTDSTWAHGTTYLSAYSQIFSNSEHRTHGLTVTVSMRNINPDDSVFINKAEYYNTHGELIRTYFDQSIYIAPLETVEIVIDEVDQQGGTGANFLFYWSTQSQVRAPFFEAVMISTTGQQGLSFTTQGIRLS